MIDRSITVHNLAKHYGEVLAVDDVSFDVASGQIFGFLGPNGAGKSTTIKILTTLALPSHGGARVGGVESFTVFDMLATAYRCRLSSTLGPGACATALRIRPDPKNDLLWSRGQPLPSCWPVSP